MEDLRELEWLDPLPEPHEDPELVEYARRETGMVPFYAPFFGSCPWT